MGTRKVRNEGRIWERQRKKDLKVMGGKRKGDLWVWCSRLQGVREKRQKAREGVPKV